MSNEFTITSLIKKIEDEVVYEEMKKPSGALVELDTTGLPNTGQVETEADVEKENEDEEGDEYTKIT